MLIKLVDHCFAVLSSLLRGNKNVRWLSLKLWSGTSELVADTFPLTPPKIESHFGISRGHIHHIDNTYGFDQRFPYATPIQGLYSASAGCHPAGSVLGCAGHNSAARVVRDLGLVPCWSTA